MRQYQEEYIANTRNLIELMRHKRTAGLRRKERNHRILRENLIPTLDDILTVSREDIDSLVEFADTLMRLGLDAGVRYYICKALVSYARVKEERNLLIKELYMTGMALSGPRISRGTKMTGSSAGKCRWYSARRQVIFESMTKLRMRRQGAISTAPWEIWPWGSQGVTVRRRSGNWRHPGTAMGDLYL